MMYPYPNWYRDHHYLATFKLHQFHKETCYSKYNISFLRSKCVYVKDTFVFPDIEDEQEVEKHRVIGVLVALKGSTKRQSNIIKINPPLTAFLRVPQFHSQLLLSDSILRESIP